MCATGHKSRDFKKTRARFQWGSVVSHLFGPATGLAHCLITYVRYYVYSVGPARLLVATIHNNTIRKRLFAHGILYVYIYIYPATILHRFVCIITRVLCALFSRRPLLLLLLLHVSRSSVALRVRSRFSDLISGALVRHTIARAHTHTHPSRRDGPNSAAETQTRSREGFGSRVLE